MLVAVPSALSAIDELRRGVRGLEQASDALGRNDTREARDVAAASAASFSRALEDLRSGWVAGARIVPGVRRHIRVGEAFARAGGDAARANAFAATVLDAAPDGGWRVNQGSIELAALRRASAAQRRVVEAVGSARTVLGDAPGRWLAGSLSGRRAEALRRAQRAEASARRTLGAVELAERFLGSQGDRRYLVLLADPAEGRGTGGVWRQYLVAAAVRGRLALADEPAGDPASLPSPTEASEIPEWFRRAYGGYGSLRSWSNLNLSPDFPTVAEIARTASRPTAGEFAGVVQLTPPGLAALLRLTGPVTIPERPEPIDADGVTDLLHRPSQTDGGPLAGASLFAPVARATLARLFAADVSLNARALRSLGEAVEGGHVQIHSPDPSDADAITLLGLSGAVDRTQEATDVVGVVTSNRTGTRSDADLSRRLRYVVSLDPSTRRIRGRLTLTLRNASEERARQIVVLLRPPQDGSPAVEVGGRAVQPTRDPEAELIAYHAEVAVPARGETTLVADFSLPRGMVGTGRTRTYRLHLFTQPLPAPPPVEVEIEPLRGWMVQGEQTAERHERGDVVLTLELRQPFLSWMADTLVFRPWRALRGLL